MSATLAFLDAVEHWIHVEMPNRRRHLRLVDLSGRWSTCPYTERWFLSAILRGPKAMHHTWFLLVPSDFSDRDHASIWATCLWLHREAKLVHEVSVMDALASRFEPVITGIADEFIYGDDEHAVLLARAAHIKKFSVLRRRVAYELAGEQR